ncbi:hypothetical protein [Modestobacter caceresii]|uniref:hypothetical protein n=1 Tax=Modestobacter caceresii TaxID=1522368 RepID=UPI000A46912F|nr:hypothetical protein [Modestobacter caceresii]
MAAAGQALADAIARRDSLDPRAAALEAYEPGGPTVAEIEALIRHQRGEAPTDTSPPTG